MRKIAEGRTSVARLPRAGSCVAGLAAALAARAWLLLGWAIPFLGYGLFKMLMPAAEKAQAVPLGFMFIGVALSFTAVQHWQLRDAEREHESH